MLKLILSVLAGVALCAAGAGSSSGQTQPPGSESLASAFRNPPDSARPWVYWFWIDGNITREGITADLEAMQRVGIRGVIVMEVDTFVPKGPVRFLTPKWREMFQHALKEASRLGIEVAMNNDAGWFGSGGPWIRPEQSMQMTVWTETRVSGPRSFSAVLPQPKTNEGFYRDIAVLAFPTPPAESVRMAAAGPKITWGPARRPLDAAKLTDGNPTTVEELPALAPDQPHVVSIDFDRPFAARAMTVVLDRFHAVAKGVLAVSDDGRTYRNVRDFTATWPVSTVTFDRISSRYFRVTFTQGGRTAATLPIGELELTGGARIEDITGKAVYMNEPFLSAGTNSKPTPGTAIGRARVVNISARMDKNGRLNWSVPAGNWTLLRFGHTSTGQVNHPAPKEGTGLECDKLSEAAVDTHFAGMMEKLIADQNAAGVKSMKYVHIDSWEGASQNWTARMREEFRARRGYDLLPFLPTLTGRVVDSPEASERFLWDLRRTIADMVNDNYAARFRKLAHDRGLQLSMEPYGNGPLDDLPYGGRADLMITEFWMGTDPWWGVKGTASAVHTYGQKVLAAEAFTSRSPAGKWQAHPFRMKPTGDQMFAAGVNRFIFHRYTMQPWLNRWPGITMGPYGIEFERTVTWWEQSRAYLDYVSRCQHLLQQGKPVADVGYLSAEHVSYDFQKSPALTPETPAGYDYDLIPAELILKMEVRDGRPVLPGGMSYRVLVMPAAGTMRVAQLRKIRDLVQAGATLVGAPPSKSPSLAEFGSGDAEVRKLARELWGECDGANITENRVGNGKVVWGKPLIDVLIDEGAPPDFTSLGVEAGKQIRYAHRTAGDKDIYFIASSESQAATFLCNFRVAGKRPEFWWPDSGRIERVAAYRTQPGQTRIPIRLDPYGSVFVVFVNDDQPLSEPVAAVTRDGVDITGLIATSVYDLRGKMQGFTITPGKPGQYELEAAQRGTYEVRTATGKRISTTIANLPDPIQVAGPWEVTFPKGWGAPERIALDRLASWTAHPDPGVKYFSGTATYHRSISIPATMLGDNRALYLDLGRVEVIAEVRLNGKDLGILWKPPFRVNITAAARAGENSLEVRVVNLWPNRLIGDERLPRDGDWDWEKLKSWPKWVLDGASSPTGRLTFMTWLHWSKNDALLDSGLLGSVTIEATEKVELNWPGSIETVAGGSGQDRIGTPSSVATDAAGNVFIAINNRRLLLRLDAKTGVVTRIAGRERNGRGGDNGPSESADLSRPTGVAVDSAGNIYIADAANSSIRKISNGIITTVAGDGSQAFGGDNGPATQAKLNNPAAVAVDSAGNIYIADWGNHRIRKVSNGIITTIAGTGVEGDGGDNGPAIEAQLRQPSGLAIDKEGNLYIADVNTPRVRKIAKGIITTVAGNGIYGYSGDGGPATQAQLSNPVGLALDGSGTLYIADAGNARIRRVVLGGVMTTAAGTGAAGDNGDGVAATNAQFDWPRSVAVSPTGDVYIADMNNGCVRKLSYGRPQ